MFSLKFKKQLPVLNPASVKLHVEERESLKPCMRI